MKTISKTYFDEIVNLIEVSKNKVLKNKIKKNLFFLEISKKLKNKQQCYIETIVKKIKHSERELASFLISAAQIRKEVYTS